MIFNRAFAYTTRQDIQIHYVSLDRTPELWAISNDDITLQKLVEIPQYYSK
jgi:sulfite reductase (ferredoxin)